MSRADRYPESYVRLSDGTALLKDPASIDGGTYFVNFHNNGLAEVLDVEGEPFCVASEAVAVAICLLLNEEDGKADGIFPAADYATIVERMKASGDAVPQA